MKIMATDPHTDESLNNICICMALEDIKSECISLVLWCISPTRSTALANPFIIYTALTSPSDFRREFHIQTYPLTSMVVGTKMIFNTSTARERNLQMYSSHVATMSWRETLSSRRRRHASCRMLCCKGQSETKSGCWLYT